MARSGDKIGPYTLVCKLGRGAFGAVWLAEKASGIATIPVALKIPNDDDVDLDAIRQEASLWVRASGHSNVLPIIDADIYDEQVVIVSEYAPDGTLSKWLEAHGGKAPSVVAAMEMMLGILAGLEHLHERGVIHRDLKPDNILLQRNTPRLADFGIARILKTTSKGTFASGTPAYMSPEAFDGKRSARTDIWSVGVIFYQLLTGSLPFPQRDMASLIAAIVTKEPEPFPETIHTSLQEIVRRALDKDSEKRYNSASLMLDALREAYPIVRAEERLREEEGKKPSGGEENAWGDLKNLSPTVEGHPLAGTDDQNDVSTIIEEAIPETEQVVAEDPGAQNRNGETIKGEPAVSTLEQLEGEMPESSSAKESKNEPGTQSSDISRPITTIAANPPEVPPVVFGAERPDSDIVPVSDHDLRPPVPGRKILVIAAVALFTVFIITAGVWLSRSSDTKSPVITNRPTPVRADSPTTQVSGQENVRIQPPSSREYEFETVELDATGAVIKRAKGNLPELDFNLGNTTLEMVELPSGTFDRGSPRTEVGHTPNEEPLSSVSIQGFYISKTEVTQAQWQAVMKTNPSRFRGDDRPVENVSWNDAVEFCQKLSQMTGRQFRLPSEAEWEYACRANSQQPFAYGETIIPSVANYDSRFPYGNAEEVGHLSQTVPVGSVGIDRIPNAFGLFDMHGNVWEWCEDNYHYSYKNAPKDGSAWIDRENTYSRVKRGGSWDSKAKDCRAANRLSDKESSRSSYTGFRVALAKQQ